MALYAAYGSNMDPKQMLERAPFSPHRGVGWIQGWRLTFGGEDIGWEGSVATIVEDPEAQVFVSLYDLDGPDESALDKWEGIPTDLYRKIRVRVETLDGASVCFVYVLNGFEGGEPSPRYLGIMIEAAIAAGAPDDYVAELLKRAH
ncbi:MAG: gamma-glutamylcyclotransferase [Actinomycetes bacterium]